MSAITSTRKPDFLSEIREFKIPIKPPLSLAESDRTAATSIAETQRGRQFARVVTTAQALRGLRYGLTLPELNRDVAERSGYRYHPRTTRRDVGLLLTLGVVEELGNGRYRGCGDVFSVPPGKVGESTDRHARKQNRTYRDDDEEADGDEEYGADGNPHGTLPAYDPREELPDDEE